MLWCARCLCVLFDELCIMNLVVAWRDWTSASLHPAGLVLLRSIVLVVLSKNILILRTDHLSISYYNLQT